MKKSYKKLIIILSLVFVILFFFSFLFNITNKYLISLFILIILGIIKIVVGLERPKHRYVKQINYEIIICMLAFFLLFYILGFFLGFYKNNINFSFDNIKDLFIPLIIYILLKEYLRYHLICKSGDYKLLLILSCVLFALFDVIPIMNISIFDNNRSFFLFIALYFLPALSNSILCSYVTKYYGYIPAIVYLFIIEFYKYLIPIIPNPSQFLYSVIFFLLPIVILFKINKFTKKTKVEKINSRIKTNELITLIPASIIMLLFVYFVSGYFRFYSIAIVTNSMNPVIYKGDVVIIDKEHFELEEGNIIAFKYDDNIIVHRIDEILVEDDELFIYTKGDANKDRDNYIVRKDMVLGEVKVKIPLIGYPTVIINSF